MTKIPPIYGFRAKILRFYLCFSILRDIYLMKSRLSADENLKSEYNPQTENNYLKTNKMGKKVFVTRKTLKTVFEVMTYVSLFIDFLKWYGYFMPLF